MRSFVQLNFLFGRNMAASVGLRHYTDRSLGQCLNYSVIGVLSHYNAKAVRLQCHSKMAGLNSQLKIIARQGDNECCVQWNPVYGWKFSHLRRESRTRDSYISSSALNLFSCRSVAKLII